VHVQPNAAKVAEADVAELAVPLSRIFAHYTLNRFFLEDDQLLRNLDRIVHLPCAIVQGRFDATTPAAVAWTLHRAWPGSFMRIVPEGAHDELDPPVARAVLEAHEELKAILS
jgi:proline iminopeptidase